MTTPVVNDHAKCRRGYVLLEVAIGAALAAVIIGSLFAQLAEARKGAILAARDTTAKELVVEGVELVLATPYAAVASAADTVINGLEAPYTRRVDVVTNPPATILGQSVGSKTVTVTVTYQSITGAREHTGTLTRYDNL